MINNKFFFWVLVSIGFIVSSCDNTLNLVEQGEDVPIVYGLISSINNEQFIRVERGFIDPFTPANEIAQIADSVYYQNANVRLINLTTNESYTLEEVNAADLGYERKDGFFLTDPNYVYYHNGSDNDFNPGDRIRFELKTDEMSEPVFSEINLLDTLIVAYPKPNAQMSIPTEADLKLQWVNNKDNPASLYTVNMYIRYDEANLEDEEPELEPKLAVWRMGEVRDENVLSVKGIDFYKFLGSNLPKGDNYVRTFEYIDFEFIYSGEELTKYLDFINANIGITSSQPLPAYTNLSQGIGLIAERNKQYLRNVFLNNSTLDSLKAGRFTKDLGF